jgi:hypothetical protein
MTTLEFLNRNSTSKINQNNWDEEIFINQHILKKDELCNEDDFIFYTEDKFTYEVNKHNNTYYRIGINKNDIELDVIDKIELRIDFLDEVYKVLFRTFTVILGIYDYNSYRTKILDANIIDICVLSYLNNHYVEEDNNIITIPLIQFDNKNKFVLDNDQELIFSIKNYTDDEFILLNSTIMNKVELIISGKKYSNNTILNIKKIKYNPIDINWNIYNYNKLGICIGRISSKYKCIMFSLVKNFENTKILSPNEVNDWLNNQPEIESITFQYENTIPWEYNIKYMRMIKIFGINSYILPLYSEFIKLDNMLYNLSSSKSYIKPDIDPYKLIIKTDRELEKYNIYISFLGEWL